MSTARALKRHGWSVTVLEQGSALPTSGTMLGMWPAAINALDSLGVDEASRRAEGWVTLSAVAGTRLWTPAGRTLLETPGGVDLNLVSRPALLSALAQNMDISFNRRIEDPAQFDGADLVVGADGTFSSSRRRIFGDPFRARSLGAVAWRGTVAGTVGGYGETWAPGALFGITPAGPDATNWYACVHADQTFDRPHLSQLMERFGSWHRAVRQVLDRVDEDAVLHHELFETPKLPSFFSGRTALVGDAAHAMAPFLGRGAGETIVDGAALARSVAQASTVEGGLTAYDRERRTRTQRLVRFSRLMGQFAMARTGAQARDAAIGTIGHLLKLGAKSR
jgi:2-polyprenyl-6-methoxyphenol hydroxylase-like FAD-dependent oxidoreductase